MAFKHGNVDSSIIIIFSTGRGSGLHEDKVHHFENFSRVSIFHFLSSFHFLSFFSSSCIEEIDVYKPVICALNLTAS